jgi:fatty acid desaturase
MSAMLSAAPRADLNTPEMQRKVNALRTLDNVTNWLFLVREYSFLAVVLACTIGFYHFRGEWGLAWAWNVPVTLLAITLIGACQHRISTLAHEASHYMLFRNRVLNEVASDWFCMYPMLSSTQHYRLQHLAHHQYVNDPERDPDVTQMQGSGHKFRFPMARWLFVWKCVILQFIWLPGLFRYIRMRAKYAATGGGTGPYRSKQPQSRLLIRVGMLYMLMLVGVLIGLTYLGDPWLLGIVPAVLGIAALWFYALARERLYPRSLIKTELPMRWHACLRMTHMTLMFTSLAWLTYLTDQPYGWYFVLLWLVPLATSFAFFMILRQIVQHGNAGQGRLTNTCVFRVSRIIQFAVFPLGMDYHLPHHLFPLVPHYRLHALHDLLMHAASYRDQATVVDGYFFPKGRPPANPTVLDLMTMRR